jgi:hypothetical protein
MRNVVGATLLGRIRIFREAAPPRLPAIRIALAEGPELRDDDLEQVVGGLERAFIPGAGEAGTGF